MITIIKPMEELPIVGNTYKNYKDSSLQRSI